MSKANEAATQPSTREYVLERVFEAPRPLVWQAWTQPEHLQQWWGPQHWTLPVCNIDLRPGGVWHYCMRGPNGEESWGKAIYREIVEPERLVYVDAFSDAEGNIAEGMPEMVITVEFVDLGDKTRVISRTEFASAADLQAVLEMGMEEGIKQTWDRLEAYLASR
jgi:uncharacterized protein YndB with AHSA1/START domain